ncbi:MAG: flagellar biosynthesis protein FlhF [Desulfuromonas sp.]|nr:flagellar biosynthesis protein FlhF [Desulfuromonas sp.]
MQVRIFESENMDSALRQIKETLGPDALILSSRTVRKGGMGLFGKPILEVTAAIDPANENSPDADGSVESRSGHVDTKVGRGVQDDVSYQDLWRQKEHSKVEVAQSETYSPVYRRSPEQLRGAKFDKILHDGQQDIVNQQNVRSYDNKSLSDLHSEVGELRSLLTSLVNDLPVQIEKATQHKPQPLFAAPTKAGFANSANQPVLDALTKLGIEADAAATIAHYAANQLSAKQIADPAMLNAFFGKTIAELVQTTGDILPELGTQKRLALIGPTGVGKTTTIAKLAAAYLLMGGKRVAMVTIDTYRIAAVEQLKVYGEIMNLPVEVVISPAQLREVLQRHSNKDLVLIDTAGRSPKDDVSLNELQDFLAVDDSIEAHLVLSATTRERDLYETANRFGALEPKSLLMTKLDECASLGVLLNVHLRNNCPLSYLANGQKVPEDLVQANAEMVSALILEHSEG